MVHDTTPPTIVVQPQSASRALVTAGYIFAFLLPLIGLILGIVVMAKNRVAHGIGIIGLSLTSWVLVFMVLAAVGSA